MTIHTEEFERNFRDARDRVLHPRCKGKSNGKAPDELKVSLDDFQAYMPNHAYIFEPTGELWTASSINARFPQGRDRTKASSWLDRNKAVEQMTWSPGEPNIIEGRLKQLPAYLNRWDSQRLEMRAGLCALIPSFLWGLGCRELPILVTCGSAVIHSCGDRCVATRGSRAFRGQRGVGGKVGSAGISRGAPPRSRAAGAFRRWKSSRSRFWI